MNHHNISLGFCQEKVPYGRHMCLIYDNDEERKEIVAKYLKASIDESELALYIVDTMSVDSFQKEMKNFGVDLPSDQINIDTSSNIYFPNGIFNSNEMISKITDFVSHALSNGKSGVRGSGEMSWALKILNDSRELMKYEATLNKLVEKLPILSICQYDSRKFNGSTIIDVLRTHPFIITKGMIVQNPYYIDPDQFISTQITHSITQTPASPQKEIFGSEILNNLLLLQTVLWSLPTIDKIFESILEMFKTVPGVSEIKSLIFEQTQLKKDPLIIAQLKNPKWNYHIDLKTFHNHFGTILFNIDSQADFQYYLPHLQNVCNFASILIENNHHRKLWENQQLVRKSQRLEAIGTLASGIAHDFNNILSIMMGCAEISIEDLKRTPDLNLCSIENLMEIVNAGSRAKELINQILLFCRQKEKEFIPLKIQPIIFDAIKMLKATFPKEIEINLDITDSSEMILGDPIQIYQILINLLTNARQAILNNCGSISVSLNLTSVEVIKSNLLNQVNSKHYFELKIQDSGIGMSDEVYEHLFEPFFTTKEKGTGLGLSVVYGIVKSMNGEIQVESKLDHGTTFKIYFPIL